MKMLQELINNDYRVHMQLDNLPVAIRVEERWVSLAFPCDVMWCGLILCYVM